jgi:hypothetical protein
VCERYETVVVDDNAYMVQNNVYNQEATLPQCITVDPNTGAFKVDRADNFLRLNGAPASYPFIWKGCHWGLCTDGSGLPLKVAEIGEARSSWDFTVISKGVWNVSYDIWINSTPTTPKGADGAELMIWLNSRLMTPYGKGEGMVSLSGYNWKITRTGFDIPFIVYRSTTDLTSVTDLDLKAFIDDAVSRGWISREAYLITVDAGFELWRGGAGMATNSFSFTTLNLP